MKWSLKSVCIDNDVFLRGIISARNIISSHLFGAFISHQMVIIIRFLFEVSQSRKRDQECHFANAQQSWK